MSHSKMKTILPPRMDVRPNNLYRPWLPNPAHLRNLAGDLVNDLPAPVCWEWDVDDVAKWLRKEVGLPEYKNCFIKNFINGRRLLRIDASVCPIIGIQDLSHIKRITSSIRKLFHVELEDPGRSISLPPRYPLTHFLLFKIPTGPIRENTTRVELFRKMGILDAEEPCPFGHWEMLVPTQPDFSANKFGLIKRKTVYIRDEHLRQPRGHSYLKKSKLKRNYFLRVDLK